ncbi:MAG: D-glycerate dehydrogenase [Phycisphaerae bacterium]|nr:D-glycerate dehydrogenase [Phycisphaerales bacterium]
MDLQQHKRAGEAVVVVTRSVPGEVAVTGATVRVMGDQKPSADELKAAIRGASVVVTMFSDRVDRAFLDAAGPSLKGICNFAVGFDNIDLAACRERGVIVTNTPHAVTEGTADLAWTLILAVARRLIEADRFARSPEYPARGPLGISEFLGADLTGRNLLIVGAGRIGYATALRSIGWGMRVMYTARSRHVDFELAPLAGRRVTLEEGLREADVISIHTPLTPQTRHLIDARAIALMKPTAILVNTSRGPVVDEAALAAALQDRRIFGAGLDVFEDEPRVHPGLIGLTNCTLTPHIGSAEDKYRRLMTEMVCENAAAIIAGREPPNRIA